MKLKHVGMIVVSVLAMSSAAVSAAEGDESVTTTVNGGVIHFKGEVVNAACAIDSESMNQTVELGQVRSSRLAKAGDLSSAVGFNIKLNDCYRWISRMLQPGISVFRRSMITVH